MRAGVPRAANSIGNFINDPIGSIQRGVSGLVDIVTNPGAAAQAISDREFITNVLLTAATLTGDDALRHRVATDVGGAAVAFVIEARVGEAAVGGAARVARPVVAASVDTLSSALQSLAAQRAVRTILSEAIPSPSPLAGARVTGQASAESANAAFSGGNSIYDPPYTPGTVVREFTTTQPTTLVRVTVDPASTTGRFFVQAREIAGKTPEEIRIYLGLELTPAYIQRVTIPIGTVLREGKVGPQLRFLQPTVSPGAIQFQASGSSRIAETNFGNLVPIHPGVPVR